MSSAKQRWPEAPPLQHTILRLTVAHEVTTKSRGDGSYVNPTPHCPRLTMVTRWILLDSEKHGDHIGNVKELGEFVSWPLLASRCCYRVLKVPLGDSFSMEFRNGRPLLPRMSAQQSVHHLLLDHQSESFPELWVTHMQIERRWSLTSVVWELGWIFIKQHNLLGVFWAHGLNQLTYPCPQVQHSLVRRLDLDE